ncbi:BQ2448_3993 [Microbotryum intermedium]|uniref:BQ2448_3993 protein n=1 Tax=Microbotryum intermedium TaxID=269621 RepID=A0A238FMZ5_9BASI|nr:BQ2448_3993 [Microbotryum intermedium]
MPLPDESSRPSASSLIKRFEAISASHDSSSAPPMNRSGSGGVPRRIWSNPSSTTPAATSGVASSLAVVTKPTTEEQKPVDISKPLPEPPKESDETKPDMEPKLASMPTQEAAFSSPSRVKIPPPVTSREPLESTTILFSGSSPTTPIRSVPPPIITQSSLDVDGPPVHSVPGSADGLLASSPLHPTSLTELVAGGSKFSGYHSKSPSVDSASSRISHEGLSQPTSPRVDSQRLSVPPVRGEASPPPSDSEDSPQELKFAFPVIKTEKTKDAADSPASGGFVATKESPKDKATPPSTSSPRASLMGSRPKSTSPPIRRTVSRTVPLVPKARASITSPTASSLAKTRPPADKSPPLSPKTSPKRTNASLPKTTTTGADPRSNSSASVISRGGAPSPTLSTASRSSAFDGRRSRSSRATTPSTPSRSPPMTRKGTTTTTTTTSSLNTPAGSTTRTPSSSPSLTSSTPTKFPRGSSATVSKIAPEREKAATRVGNVKMASRGRIGLAGAPVGANPAPRGAKKVEQTKEKQEGTEEETGPEKEAAVEAPRDEDIPDIPSDDENERVFDPTALQGGRPAPGRIGIPIDVDTGRAVGDDQVKAAQQ